jgi:hypothetical protein
MEKGEKRLISSAGLSSGQKISSQQRESKSSAQIISSSQLIPNLEMEGKKITSDQVRKIYHATNDSPISSTSSSTTPKISNKNLVDSSISSSSSGYRPIISSKTLTAPKISVEGGGKISSQTFVKTISSNSNSAILSSVGLQQELNDWALLSSHGTFVYQV